jgi:hypothetical protein
MLVIIPGRPPSWNATLGLAAEALIHSVWQLKMMCLGKREGNEISLLLVVLGTEENRVIFKNDLNIVFQI